MGTRLCKLTLVYPAKAEEALIDALHVAHRGLRGFTTSRAEGHGLGFDDASTQEKLRGRVERGMLFVVLPREQAPAILAHVRVAVPVPHLIYWIEPVDEMGVLE